MCGVNARLARRERPRADRTRETGEAAGSACAASQTKAKAGGAARADRQPRTGTAGTQAQRRPEDACPNGRQAKGLFPFPRDRLAALPVPNYLDLEPIAEIAVSDNVTNELLLEHLKALQTDAKLAREERREIRDELRAVKGHIAALVQSDLNRDSDHASLVQRIDRIERRLEITDT